MISIVLYGRNDSYGYNLHKRAALSLNCMAEVLSAPSDEILFVDYNTPDDFPTFPEAIQDTLTDKAKQRLRILRVRPSVHRRFQNKTHLIALEPVSRNVAIRRSNPDNRWILSTNTDMIFVPRSDRSLSEIVTGIPAGFYHIPRFEIPETMWEMFHRKDAIGTIASIAKWGRKAHLNEIVFGSPTIKYDAPGDFQLIERNDLFRMHGFDEDMLLGWHVDSNIAKRLHLIYGKVGDLVGDVFGYHCDHTRQVTPMHRHNSVQNDIQEFIDDVGTTEKSKQAETWGCPDDDIEEIHLMRMRNQVYLEGLDAVISTEMTEPTEAFYTSDSYNKVSYDSPHILPFVTDIFVNAPMGTRIGWVGGNSKLFALFANVWQKLGIGGPIVVPEDLAEQLSANDSATTKIVASDAFNKSCDAFIFDYALANANPVDEAMLSEQDLMALAKVKSYFFDQVSRENISLEQGRVPRRFVCVNAIHNSFEPLASSFLSVARTPFSSRIRQGFVIPIKSEELDWTSKMLAGPAGKMTPSGIQSHRITGHVMYGPYQVLLCAKYRARVSIETATQSSWMSFSRRPEGPCIVLEAVAGDEYFAQTNFSRRDLDKGYIEIEFALAREDFIAHSSMGLEIRLWSSGECDFAVTKVTLTRID